MTVVIGGKSMVRAAHGERRLVEVVVKKTPVAHRGQPKRTGRAHVSTHTLHHWADQAFANGQEVHSKAPAERFAAADYATPYEALIDTYHKWQATRTEGGIVAIDPYTEYTGLVLMARHIMRSSILLDHDETHSVPYVRSRNAKYSPRALMAAHAINLALKINEECDNPYVEVKAADTSPPRIAEFMRKGQISFALGMLMRNGEGTAAVIPLTSAVQRLFPDFVVDPVKFDARTPTSVAGMLSAHGAANRHRTCT